MRLGAACDAPRNPQLPNIQPVPIPIEVPIVGVQALTSGAIAINTLQNDILSLIGESPNDVTFAQEYERGPSMTLISMNSPVVGATEQFLKGGAPNALPPLERDMAFCGSTEVNNTRTALPTAPYYQMPEVRIDRTTSNPQGTLLGALRRVGGRLVQFSIAANPPSPPATTSTTFQLDLAIRNIEVEVEVANVGYFIRADSIMISCPGEIIPAAANTACGEQVVRCTTPTVTISGYSNDVPFLALVPDAATKIEALLHIGLTLGVKLHFQNFAASGLEFVTDSLGSTLLLSGHSTLMPDGTSVCSPVPPPEPPPAPTRALARSMATWGRGEFIGSLGNVMPFDLIPREEVELTASNLTAAFMLAKDVELKGENAFGVEAPSYGDQTPMASGQKIPFTPYALTTRLRMTRRVPRECWVKPVPTPLFQELVESTPHVVRAIFDGEQTTSQRLPDSFKESQVRFTDIQQADFEREIAPLLKEADISCEKCGEGAWSRVELISIPADPFGDREPRLPPTEIIVWLNRDAREIKEMFNPSLECGVAQKYETIVGERRLSGPRVLLNPYKIDSIDLPSTRLTTTDGKGMSTRNTVSLPWGPVVEITLTDRCPIDSASPCWEEAVPLPSLGSVTVEEGISGTTVPRASIRTRTSAAFGSRTVAVHGLFDRSGIAVFTDVPQIYRDIGLTTAYSDYRGMSHFDWNHTPAPSAFDIPAVLGAASPVEGHMYFGKTAFHAQPRRYFADWRSDVVRFSHRASYPMSYCTLAADMFAAPTKLLFKGGGLMNPTYASPSEVFTSPAGPSGDFRVNPSTWGAASAAPLLGP